MPKNYSQGSTDRRHLNPGRPKNSDVGRPSIEHDLESNFRPNVRVWIEGEIIIRDFDDERHGLRYQLAKLLDPAQEINLTEAINAPGLPRTKGLTYCEQVLKEGVDAYGNFTGVLNTDKRRRTNHNNVSGYKSIHEFTLFLTQHPGLTIAEIAEQFYPLDPIEKARKKIHVNLARIDDQSRFERRVDKNNVLRIYPKELPYIPVPRRIQFIAEKIQNQFGESWKHYIPLAEKIAAQIDQSKFDSDFPIIDNEKERARIAREARLRAPHIPDERAKPESKGITLTHRGEILVDGEMIPEATLVKDTPIRVKPA